MRMGDPNRSGPRRDTLLGIRSPFQPGKLSRDPKDPRGQIRPPVILDQMKKGGTRQENYYYIRDGKKLFSLKLDISCDDPKRVYTIEIMEVNFGEELPHSATIKFSGNGRCLTLRPTQLIGNSKLMPKPYVSLVLDSSITTVVIEIEIAGSPVLPRYLTATIRNCLVRRT